MLERNSPEHGTAASTFFIKGGETLVPSAYLNVQNGYMTRESACQPPADSTSSTPWTRWKNSHLRHDRRSSTRPAYSNLERAVGLEAAGAGRKTRRVTLGKLEASTHINQGQSSGRARISAINERTSILIASFACRLDILR